MINEAIKKITDEMMKLDDPFAQVIEEYLVNKCTNTTIAEKLLVKDKSLKEICSNIKKEAENRVKTRTGTQVVAISDDEVYKMVDTYYGLNEDISKINILELL